MGDTRPQDCRFRLQDEGKAYPRSSCTACGKTVVTGLGTYCQVSNVATAFAGPNEITILRSEVEQLRSFKNDWERRNIPEEMIGASRYWEARYRDEAAEVERLTKERDGYAQAAQEAHVNFCVAEARAGALTVGLQNAEKANAEYVAELNKALETLGQLRSDLQKAEEARDFEEKFKSIFAEQRDTAEARTQSAEASLVKLREAAVELVKDAEPIKAVDCAWQGEIDEYRVDVKKFDSLRSLLDEPDKDHKQ